MDSDERKKISEERNKKLDTALKELLKSVEGRRVYWFIICLSGVFDVGTPNETKSVGLRLITRLEKVDKEALIKILKTKGD